MPTIYYESIDDAYTQAEKEHGRGPSGPVNEQHPLPVQLAFRPEGEDEHVLVDEAKGLPTHETGVARIIGGLVETGWLEIPGIDAGNALDASDAMGLMGIASSDINGNPLPKRGIILAAKLLDIDDDTLSATCHVFSRPLLSAQTSDSALAIAIADARNWITSIAFTVTTDVGTTRVSEVVDIDSPFYLPTGQLMWQFSTAGTPNIAAGAMPLVKFFIMPMSGTS